MSHLESNLYLLLDNGGNILLDEASVQEQVVLPSGVSPPGSIIAENPELAMWFFPKEDKSLVARAINAQPGFTFDFESLGGGSYIDANGDVQVAGANTPRFDHRSGTLDSLGLLIQAQFLERTFTDDQSWFNNQEGIIYLDLEFASPIQIAEQFYWYQYQAAQSYFLLNTARGTPPEDGVLDNGFDFTQAIFWDDNGTSVAASSILSPDAITNAYWLQDTSSIFSSLTSQPPKAASAGQTWTASIYVYKDGVARGTDQRFFGLRLDYGNQGNLTGHMDTDSGETGFSGAVSGTVTSEMEIDGWWRLRVTAQAPVGTTSVRIVIFPAIGKGADLNVTDNTAQGRFDDLTAPYIAYSQLVQDTNVQGGFQNYAPLNTGIYDTFLHNASFEPFQFDKGGRYRIAWAYRDTDDQNYMYVSYNDGAAQKGADYGLAISPSIINPERFYLACNIAGNNTKFPNQVWIKEARFYNSIRSEQFVQDLANGLIDESDPVDPPPLPDPDQHLPALLLDESQTLSRLWVRQLTTTVPWQEET